jgi:hypothetical protein
MGRLLSWGQELRNGGENYSAVRTLLIDSVFVWRDGDWVIPMEHKSFKGKARGGIPGSSYITKQKEVLLK